MTTTHVAIYGAGGFARELAWLVEACAATTGLAVECLIDDNPANHAKIVNGIAVMSLSDAASCVPRPLVVGGVGDPRLRAKLMEQAATAGFAFATLVHPRTEM